MVAEKNIRGARINGTFSSFVTSKYRLLTNVPIAIASAIGVAIIPNVVQVFARKEYDQIHMKVEQAVKFNMLIAIPCAVGMGVLAQPIMQLMFPDTVESVTMSANMMKIGAASIVFFAYSTTTNSILQAVNRMRFPVIHGLISLAVYLVLDYVLLSFTPLGVYALVIGNMVFPLVISILNWLAIRRELDYRQEVMKTFLRTGLSAGCMGVIAFLAYTGCILICKSNAVSTILAIGIGVFTYAVLIIVFRAVDEEELYELPKGGLLVRFAKKLHLL